MDKRYPLIAAAVAAAVASYHVDAQPTLAQAQSPVASLVIAGSSAAAPGFEIAIEKDLCGGSGATPGSATLAISSVGGSKNFLAYSCATGATFGSIPSGSIITVYYRTEGGSVVGALPLVNNTSIKRLDLSNSTCATSTSTDGTGAQIATCTVTGTTSVVGTSDGWSGAVTADTVQLGITDVEPGQLVGADYPSAYGTYFGTATPAQMGSLTHSRLFDQVFGFLVNTQQGNGLTAGQAINLSEQSAKAILSGYTDWNAIPDALTGSPIGSSSATNNLVLINREQGSGTRTSANIYFLRYGCGSTNAISSSGLGNFSTGDELTQANTTPGAIAYASIDNKLNPANSSKYTNLTLATINGVTPSNLAAATGQYGWWFEATAVIPTGGITVTNSATLANELIGKVEELSYAPAIPDVLAIPGIGATVNSPTTALTNNGGSGTTEIYTNPYTRGGNSCNVASLETPQ